MPRATKTADKPQPAAPATQTAMPHVNGSPQPTSLPGLPQGGIDPTRNGWGTLLGRAHEAPPAVPHTTRLLIVRAPGGFTVFNGDYMSEEPESAIAVASTADDLVRRIRDWTTAQPAPEYPA